MVVPNPLKHSICLSAPSRLAPSGWTQHVPFGMFLVDILRPERIVELGTHYGVSYCAFCQAVQELGLPTQCSAIDTWKGDEHAGFYGSEVLLDLKEFHDRRYGHFSNLLESTFDDALPFFADGSIDLLHIDGLHTFEAIQHDFHAWLPKMSNRGVVVAHDTNCKLPGFGAWRFWDEVKRGYPNLEFLHGYGLGVLGVRQDQPSALQWLFSLDGDDLINFRQFFFRLGVAAEAEMHMQRVSDMEKELDSLRARIAALEEELSSRDQANSELSQALADQTGRIASLEAELSSRDQANLELNQVLERQTELIESLGQRAARLEEELSSRDQANCELRQVFNEQSERVESLLASVEIMLVREGELEQLVTDTQERILRHNKDLESEIARLQELTTALLQTRYALPIEGPVRQVSAAVGIWPDGWVGDELRLQVVAAAPIRTMTIEGWLPDELDEVMPFQLDIDGETVDAVMSGSRFQWEVPCSLRRGAKTELAITAGRTLSQQEARTSVDERELAFVLERLVFEPAKANKAKHRIT